MCVLEVNVREKVTVFCGLEISSFVRAKQVRKRVQVCEINAHIAKREREG